MDNNFSDHSRKVVNDFIQNVVFVDDRAYSTEKVAQDFDASEVLSIFAKEGKLCAIYTPFLMDKETFPIVLNKADAIVIDWDMRMPPIKTVLVEKAGKPVDNDDSADDNDEDDVPEEDPRGAFACDLVRSIVNDTDGIKVIIIYTGDSKLRDICENIRSRIVDLKFDKENLCLFNNRIAIAIRSKYNESDEQFKHDIELKQFIVKYKDLPKCLVEQYIRFTDGLMPNFALKALSTIRHHTPEILSVFSKDLDMGYLVHKASMEFPEDGKNLLIHIFGDAVSDLLRITSFDTNNWPNAWIDTFLSEETKDIDGVSILQYFGYFLIKS